MVSIPSALIRLGDYKQHMDIAGCLSLISKANCK